MTKHLRFLIVLLMTLVWSAGWAQTTVFHETFDKCNSTGGNDGAWGASSGGNELSTSALISQFLDNKWSNVSKVYIGNKCVKLSTKSAIGTLTTPLINSTGDFIIKIKAGACSSKSGELTVKTTAGTLDKSSVSLTADKFNEYRIELSGVTKAFTLAFSIPSKKQSFIDDIEVINKASAVTKKDPGISFGETTYTANITDKDETYHSYVTLNNPNNLSVTYASSKTDVAEVNAAGEVKVLGLGTTTISATFAGDDTYEEATAKYTLNVIDPNKTDVTFDFTKPSNFGYTDVKIELNEGDKLTKDGFVLENVQAGKYTTRLHEGYLKIYASDKNHPAKGKISLSAPAGCVINRIVFTDDSGSPVSNLTFSIGEIDSNSKTWTGSAKALTMEVAQAQVFIQKMTIYFVKETETITLNETAINNTIVAKTGVNVTLKRTMAKGVWNTICLPFGLTSGQITTVFGVGVKVAQLDDTNSTGATLKFVDMTDAGIEASVPYLIKPVTDAPADGYKFVGVDITKDAVIPTKVRTAGNLYFNGVYNMVDATTEVASGYNAAFLGKGNTVFGAQSGTNMKGFRAYFAIPNSVKASELRVVIDGTATSIKNIDSEVVESNAPVYNLQGQRVDGSNLTPGIYVKAGKKFVVK